MSSPTGKTRDWIAVDQLLRRLLDNAVDEFEREVLTLAAEATGGPDPDTIGGGADWQSALTTARHTVQAALTDDLAHPGPSGADDTLISDDVTKALNAAITDGTLNADTAPLLHQVLTQICERHIDTARISERAVIIEWLADRASRLNAADTTPTATSQSRILASTAEWLRATLPAQP